MKYLISYKEIETLNLNKKFEELDNIPGNASPDKQVHIFDFDDTLAKTKNSNGVMPYKDGEPLLKDEKSANEWVDRCGLREFLLEPEDNRGRSFSPSIDWIDEKGGFAIYLNSEGLARLQTSEKFPQYQKTQVVSGDGDSKVLGAGEWLLIDFTPSAYVNTETTKPITQTIDRLKKANEIGARTAVLTARKTSGAMDDLEGDTVISSNETDIEKFLQSYGAKPNSGIFGATGKNKGDKILQKFSEYEPEEIHFYDDLSKNTKDVSQSLSKDKSKEVYIYGPGDFEEGEVTVDEPSASTSSIGGKKYIRTFAQN